MTRAENAEPADSGIAEMVKQGVLKAREKLIDLSLRNGMLNYRHSESSSRHVRIINENLRVLVESLALEQALDVLPLTPVETIPRDEDTDEFRAALKAAKMIDPEWLAAEDAKRAAGNRRRYKDKAAERALRDRVRAQLGMPEWRAAIDPKVRAQELGINPSYDLPVAESAGEQDGHPKVQTLFFPDRLEPKLATIYGAARTLQEDAGISALYCAVGFLEWYETDDGPTPAYAPLVLIPINMERRVASGEYIFSIAGRDEDETTNVALREKLRQHGLELPEYDPEAGIDSYLATVAEGIRNRPRWRIRPWATIGLFSFARQAMWSDLDPLRWPVGARPEAHELLRQIYGDAPVGDLNTIAEIRDIDHPDVERKSPALVTDADASQVSAVIDAAEGVSLVIQGPPGTGKSQTITNIIANAMWEGKSILFVSEKMAALNVVKNRLDHMGLGLYCLEVHSSKASKTLALQSIKERMSAPRPPSNADEIESARDSLREARQKLTEYAAVMNSPAGRSGLTTHDVLWGDSSRSTLPDSVPPAAMEFRFPDPLMIDRFKLEEFRGAGKALDDHAAAMGPMAEPAQQPWRGTGNLNLSRFDRPKAIEAVNQWASALDMLHQRVSELIASCSWHGLGSISDANAAATKIICDIPAMDAAVEESILPLTLEDTCIRSLASWSDLALETRELESKAEAICAPGKLESTIDLVPNLLERAITLGVADTTAETLPRILHDAQTAAEQMARGVKLLARVFVIAKCDPATEPDFKAEAIAAGFLRCVQQFPYDKAQYRSALLSSDGIVEDILAAQVIAQEASAAAANAQFSEQATATLAESIPHIFELRDAATKFLTIGVFGRLFGRDWRGAKTTYRRTFPGERKLAPKNAALRLKAAAQWKEGLAKIEACTQVKAAAGRHWRGAATPLDAMLEVARWMQAVRKVTPIAESVATELRRILFEGTSDDVAIVADLARIAEELNLLALFHACYSKQSSIGAEAKHGRQRAAALTELLRGVTDTGLHAQSAIGALKNAEAAMRGVRKCRSKMALESVAVNAVGAITAETEADKALKIRATLRYGKAMMATGIPAPVVKWLFQRDHAARLSQLGRMAEGIDAAVTEEARARQRADDLLQLRADAWCGGAFLQVPIENLLQKARRAANAPESLEKQIALFSTEEEATNLGLGELISVWSSKGLRYEGVA